MSTLQEMVSTFPYPLRVRYRDPSQLGTQWISWLNDGLFQLEREDLLPELTFEAGVEVSNDIWITPPAGYRRGIELSHAEQPEIKPSITEIQGKIKIVNGMTFTKESDPEAVSAFSAQATDSVEINVTGHSEGDLKNFLLVVTGGTLANSGFILGGNDDSGVGTTKVDFLHELTSAWTAPMATAGYLVNPRNYLILKYAGFYTPITTWTEEIPVGPIFETSLKSWLLWKAHERVRNVSPDTQYHQGQWSRELQAIRNERLRLNRTRNTRGRRLAGFEQSYSNRYARSHTHESES